MFMRRLLVAAASLLLAAAAAEAQDWASVARRHLEAGTLAAGEQELSAAAAADPQARIGLGTIRTFRAVERLGQGLYRYGLEAGHLPVPILRIPLPANPKPEPLTYDGFRRVLSQFVEDLAAAERTLAEVPAAARLAVDLAAIRLDLDGDGRAEASEALWPILMATDPRFGRRAPLAEAPAAFPVTFDQGDVLWARAYAHLLMGIGEFWLAHDFSDQMQKSFQLFFPRAGLPLRPVSDGSMASFADVLAFVHLINWPVGEPRLLATAVAHLEEVPRLSRASWAAILAETDDENEWLPNPRQTNRFPNFPVDRERIEAWGAVMDSMARVLSGTALIPHFRFAEGINLRRLLLEHKTFDLVLWVTGSGVAAFREGGAVVSAEEWRRMTAVFGGNVFGYAVWFN